MKTLYVSDLDGTLIRSDQRTSAYTNDTINALVKEGMLFSYATARSYSTARKVTEAMVTRVLIPLTDEPENRLYHEYLSFYDDTGLDLIYFSEEEARAK